MSGKNAISLLATIILAFLLLCGCSDGSGSGDSGIPVEDTNPGWFVVSEVDPNHGDSYLVYLENSEDVRTANDLINGRIQPLIIVAEIDAGPDEINRNVLDQNAPYYSWHVSRFISFAGVTPEILDGWTGYVESDVSGWMANTEGEIGFWGYTITARYSSD